MKYSEFTLETINDLYIQLQRSFGQQGLIVEKSESTPYYIQILRHGDIVLHKYEFLTDEKGDWNCLLCSGFGAAREIESIEKSKRCFGRAVLFIDYNYMGLEKFAVYIGETIGLGALEKHDKLCVLHAMMHLICFDISFKPVEPDEASLDILYGALGFGAGFANKPAGKLLWNVAYEMNTMDCFKTIANFSPQIKEQIKTMIYQIVHETRQEQREMALPKLYQYCGLNR